MQAKLEEMKARFDTWLWQDNAVARQELARIYNERFNVFVRLLRLPPHAARSQQLTLRPLQKDAVWYSLQRVGYAGRG